jgi:hypothetical protein
MAIVCTANATRRVQCLVAALMQRSARRTCLSILPLAAMACLTILVTDDL